MTLENIYYVGQTVAVVVIVATLFAILYQGYQTNKIARAELTSSTWWQTGQANYSLVDSPEKAEFMYKVLSAEAPLTEADKIRFGNLMGFVIGAHEGAYMLRKRELMEEAAYHRLEGITRLYLQSRRVRAWWRRRREYNYHPEFRALIDAMCEEFEKISTGKSAGAAAGQDNRN